MNDYYDVRLDFSPCSEDATDLMAALLADEGYESFTADSEGMDAFIRAADYSDEALRRAVDSHPMNVMIATHTELIKGRDWNSEWEKNYFKPIVVGGECVIHSSFHTDVPQCRYDIVIDPKMAFGTGHHSTTSLIIRQLLDMDLTGLSVIDMGTGTGILAILAAMRGASSATGIEIDPGAYENAVENVVLNNHSEIRLILGDASALADVTEADVFIANINRNIITADLPAYVKALRQGGTMLLSGFYTDDIPVVTAAAEPLGLRTIGYTEDNRWTCLRLEKI